jgi:hypothetical protein
MVIPIVELSSLFGGWAEMQRLRLKRNYFPIGIDRKRHKMIGPGNISIDHDYDLVKIELLRGVYPDRKLGKPFNFESSLHGVELIEG